MNYKYTMPLFEKDEQKEALDYLIERITKEGEKSFFNSDLKIMRTDDEDGEPDVVDFEDVPIEILKELVSRIISSAFGIKNIVLMANYFKVQDTFFKNFETSLLSYLDLCKSKIEEANITYITPNDIVINYIIHKSMKDPSFQPISYWDPNTEWEWYLMQSSRKNRNDDYMNPLNHLKQVYLNIKGSIPISFAYYLDNYGIELVNIDTGDNIIKSMSIQLLPFPSYSNLVTIMQAIHKYF